jgi:hypothetical protein
MIAPYPATRIVWRIAAPPAEDLASTSAQGPVVEWFAPTAKTAWLMLRRARMVIAARAAHLPETREHDPAPSPDLVIAVDEGGTAILDDPTYRREIHLLLADIVRRGADVAVSCSADADEHRRLSAALRELLPPRSTTSPPDRAAVGVRP